MSVDSIRHKLENEYQMSSPLGTAIHASSGLEGALGSFSLLILGLMIFLSNIVSNSLMTQSINCLLYTSPSPRDKRQSRMPSSA